MTLSVLLLVIALILAVVGGFWRVAVWSPRLLCASLVLTIIAVLLVTHSVAVG